MLKWLHRGLVCALTSMSLSGLALLAFCYYGDSPYIWIVTDETDDAKFSRSLHQEISLGREVGLMQIRRYQGGGAEFENVWLDSFCYYVARISQDQPIDRSNNSLYQISEFTAVSFSTVWATVFSAIYPAIFFIRSYRHRRLRRQALKPCTKCGYDLQGNESGVCPECGKAVEHRQTWRA